MIPKKYAIKKVRAREILDSRANPTLEVMVELGNGGVAVAGVPSGASTGSHEALELRDNDRARYRGKGVRKAIIAVGALAKSVVGKDVRDQEGIDASLLVADGTDQKERFGANAMLGISMASARAASMAQGMELYEHIRHLYREKRLGNKSRAQTVKRTNNRTSRLPVPMFNILNGGAHADTNLDIQEIMVVPVVKKSATEHVRMGAEVFHALQTVLKEHHRETGVGNEGGFAPEVDSVRQAFEWVQMAIARAGYRPGKEMALALDVAASGFFDEKKLQYHFKMDDNFFDASQLGSLYHEWTRAYPIMSIEDPFMEDDFEHLAIFTHECVTGREYSARGKPLRTRKQKPKFQVMVVGDDHYATNVGRLERALITGAGNAGIVKPNQVGTITETFAFMHLLEERGLPRIVSHRSGETNDAFIVDLAVGTGAEYLKAGAPSRGERIAKYNRLMEIEERLQS